MGSGKWRAVGAWPHCRAPRGDAPRKLKRGLRAALAGAVSGRT